ncbi:MAG: DUF2791 family P-loop domain-containing protein [Elusimicrobiota bacterium]|nr:ATP-binding protein [Endomicrobiia bacterium]MDW8166345.1 DUF2791 family P-loop domain-containing protein [Elusimicrobiota bacterium]
MPPEYGIEFFTIGLDEYLDIIENEYLEDYIKNGGASFKLVVGIYGSGKTHFLYCVRNLGWKHNFVVSHVSLSKNSSPFSKMELVYKEIMKNITQPLSKEELISGYGKGINNFIRNWIASKRLEYEKKGLDEEEITKLILEETNNWDNIESISFKRAVKKGVEFYIDNKIDDYENIIQWLQGEGYNSKVHKNYGILEKIDKSTAFVMIRSLVQWVKILEYSGLIIFFDEAEQIPSLSSKDKEAILSNLRELIDECSNVRFSNIMVFYAVPDKNFLDGRTQVYEALKQRLSTFFDITNPRGVEINLDNLSTDILTFLRNLGNKLKGIYMTAYNCNLNEVLVKNFIEQLTEKVYNERYGDEGYKRRFVKQCVLGLDYIRVNNKIPNLESI